MPKIGVLIHNSEDGHPIWDEVEVIHQREAIKPAHKPHQEKQEESVKIDSHQSARHYAYVRRERRQYLFPGVERVF